MKRMMFSGALAGLFCLLLSVPVCAEYPWLTEKNEIYSTDGKSLFSTELLDHEEIPRRLYKRYTEEELAERQEYIRKNIIVNHTIRYRKGQRIEASEPTDAEIEEYIKERDHKDVDYLAHRYVENSMRIKGRETVASFCRLVVPKGVTLTVEQGATLTVMGEILVEGALVNNGTISMVEREKYTGENVLWGLGEEKLAALYANSRLTNQGSFVNRGTLLINHGSVDNRSVMENGGAIQIGIANKTLTALSNTAVEGKYAGKLTNTGMIQVSNTAGLGLANFKGAILENRGTIAKGAAGSIQGTISGNAPVTAG